MISRFRRFMKGRRGQGMTEYIIMVALIAIACLIIFGLFGKQIRQVVKSMGGALSGQQQATGKETFTVKEKGMGDFATK